MHEVDLNVLPVLPHCHHHTHTSYIHNKMKSED